MQKPLISIFLPTLLIGGAERALVELANGLAARNWRVQLLLMSRTGPLIDDINSQVVLVDLDCASYRQAVFVLAKHYREHKPAVVLTSLYSTGLAAIAAKIIASYKPKVIIGAHNSLQAKAARPDNLKDKFLLMPLCRLLFPYGDGIIAVSKSLARELEALLKQPKGQIHAIYNPVIKQELTVEADEPTAHPWLIDSSQRDFRTFISVGRLVEQKGFDILLEAFFIVRKSINCRLIIVGGGPLQASLKEKASELGIQKFVDFAGWQKNPYKFVARADLFILASRWEGLANVLIEALACGCPVVSTNCKHGPEEILEYGRYGALAEVDNPDDLAAKITHVLQSPDTPNSNQAARVSRALDFTVEASVRQYEKFFQALKLE